MGLTARVVFEQDARPSLMLPMPAALWQLRQNALLDESGRGTPARRGPSGKMIASRMDSVPAGMLARVAALSAL